MEQTTQAPSEYDKSQEPDTAPSVSLEERDSPSIIMEVAAADADGSITNTTATITPSNAEAEEPKTLDTAVPSTDVVENDGKESGCVDESKMDESSTDADLKEQKMSREMRSLINSAKDSKIISEFTQIKTKMRKPRKELDASTGSVNTSVEAEKLQGSRRSSNTSLVSSSSDVSDKPGRRSMRSINPEFVNKQRKFLNSLSGKPRKRDVEVSPGSDSESTDDEHTASDDKALQESITDTIETELQAMFKSSDKYCWRCHWLIELPPDSSSTPHCSLCPRSFHPKCLHSKAGNPDQAGWVCPECMTVLHAENSESRSPAMQKTSLSTLCTLLNYALARMKHVKGVEVFLQPVDVTQCLDYPQHVVKPMDLGRLQQNIVDGVYGSTEAFMADTMWILHNCLVYNSPRSNLTGAARALVRECRNQMGEIEACPECYAAAHARRPTWFTDVCSTPHILLWAKLKGFPFWPAKGMSVNEMGMVDVRFFGDHDRAWVQAKYCYLYCQKDPNNSKTQRTDILGSIKEAEQHIKNITRKFGSFVHALPRTVFEPARHSEQLKMMIPGYQGALPAPKLAKDHANSPASKGKRQRSTSKGSKESVLDGYVSEEEESGWRRKTLGGDDTTHDEDNASSANNSVREHMDIEVDIVSIDKSPMPLGKRRRTVLEEATVFNVLETNRKKKRTSSHETTLVKEPLNEQKEEKVLVIDKDETSKEETCEEDKVKDKRLNSDSSTTEKTDIDNNKKDGHIKKNVSEDISKEKVANIKSTPTSNKLEEDTTTKYIKSPKKRTEKPVAESTPKLCKDRIVFVDDIISEKPRAKKTVIPETKTFEKKSSEPKTPEAVFIGGNRLPTITSVCSLATDSEIISSPEKNSSPPKSTSKCATVIDTNTMARVFKVSQKRESVGSMKEAVAKLQKLREVDTPASAVTAVLSSVSTTPTASITPVVSTAPVASIPPLASIAPVVSTAPVASVAPVASTAPAVTIAPVASTAPVAMQVDIEIKAEPIDFDEGLNSLEKNEMLGSLNLRPTSSIEIESTMKTVDLRTIRRVVSQKTNVAPRARKTFPQARKNPPLAEDNRDLNGKNSMVYIPIQPPTQQVPVRVTTGKSNKTSTITLNTSSPQRSVLFSNSPAINTITTTTSSLPSTSGTTPMPTLTVATNLMPASRSSPPAPLAPAVPATAAPPLMQNVPVLSSVNGQWTLCLPSMLNVEQPTPPPLVNGLSEKTTTIDVTSAAARPALPTQLSSTNNVNINNQQSTPHSTPPPLQPRPGHPLDSDTPIGAMPVPSMAGPCSMRINQSAVKLADYFRNLLTESLQVLDEPEAIVASLRLQLEQATWKHKQELAELKHNADVQIVEMQATLEREKTAAVAEARRIAEIELNAAVDHAKSKQWCANCRQEAQFYCCWNTSYCDYPCQQAHWTQHYAVCTQQRGNPEQSTTEERTTHVKTVGGKVVARTSATTGVLRANNITNTGPGLLMNMQTSSSTTIAGSTIGYKRPPFSQPAFIINKQLMSAEESTAKVTPGGYLIVGAGNTGRPVVSHSQHTPIL